MSTQTEITPRIARWSGSRRGDPWKIRAIASSSDWKNRLLPQTRPIRPMIPNETAPAAELRHGLAQERRERREPLGQERDDRLQPGRVAEVDPDDRDEQEDRRQQREQRVPGQAGREQAAAGGVVGVEDRLEPADRREIQDPVADPGEQVPVTEATAGSLTRSSLRTAPAGARSARTARGAVISARTWPRWT